MNKFNQQIWIGIIIGASVISIIYLCLWGLTLNARDLERHRAIKARVAEYYINNRGKLEFRYLTEHKDNQLIRQYDE